MRLYFHYNKKLTSLKKCIRTNIRTYVRYSAYVKFIKFTNKGIHFLTLRMNSNIFCSENSKFFKVVSSEYDVNLHWMCMYIRTVATYIFTCKCADNWGKILLTYVSYHARIISQYYNITVQIRIIIH